MSGVEYAKQPIVLVGRRGSMTGRRATLYLWLVGLYVFMTLAYVADAIFEHRYSRLVQAAVWAAMALFWFRPAARVDERGVHLPVWSRSKRLIAWDEIDAIVAPRSFETELRLIRTDQEIVTVGEFPAAQAAAVAELGGKQLRAAPSSSMDLPARTPASPSHADEVRAFDRKAAAVDADRSRLSAELDLIRQRRAVEVAAQR